MLICRAEDGYSFEIPETTRDIERAGSLELFLEGVTGVPRDAILAYLSGGHRLTDDNVWEAITSSEQSIFVFNKNYLDMDFNELLAILRVFPSSAPGLRDLNLNQITPQLLHWMSDVVRCLKTQHEAHRIASTSLNLNVLSISDAYETISDAGQTQLRKQEELLKGIDFDLAAISKVRINPEFLPTAARKGQESGEKPRTLGDYVSKTKMKQVVDACKGHHAELQSRFKTVDESVQSLIAGSNSVRKATASQHNVEDAETCLERASAIASKLTSDVNLADPREYRISIQKELEIICGIKNVATEQYMKSLREISSLNANLVAMPHVLSALQADFKAPSSFSHIQRLHDMLYAYGATLIEVVRRNEFGSFFHQRAGIIAEMMAKLTAGEKKRRQIYRSDVQGLLPFDVRGLQEEVPSIELTSTSSAKSFLNIGRADIESEIDQIEQSIAGLTDVGGREDVALRETKIAWAKLMARMDSLETTFDRVAERALLSSSRIIRRSAIFEHPAYQDAVEQLRELQQSRSDMEAQFIDHRHSLEDEIDRLRIELQDAMDLSAHNQERAEQLETRCANLGNQLEDDFHSHQTLKSQNEKLLDQVQNLETALEESLNDKRNKSREIGALKIELTQIKSECQEIKNLEEHNASRVASLLNDQQMTLQNLEEARSRGENLETQIQVALSEGSEARRALREAIGEKDRLLRAQANEHDQRLRDHIAEADGDRAVLEQQFFNTCSQLKTARSELDVLRADISGVREELQRAAHELAEARRSEESLRKDYERDRMALAECDTRSERSQRLVAEILQVAISYRQALGKAVVLAQTASSYPAKIQAVSESIASLSAKPGLSLAISSEEAPIDPADPETALEVLREFDLDICAEMLAKPTSVLRKWQKQCKDYRERAKGKITFRNFTRGDLALFLPIKNSQQKPWAAFNVAFPHYFLQATGHIADQLKTREWIVARITSITEKIADHKDPDSNPYGLSDGIKYYMCQVEDWTQPSTRRNNTVPLKHNGVDSHGEISPRNLQAQGSRPTGSVMTDVNQIPSPTTQVDTTLPLPSPPVADPEGGVLEPSPGSHLFPSRVRTQSSPSRAGPSSLSKLLAQAPLAEVTTVVEDYTQAEESSEAGPSRRDTRTTASGAEPLSTQLPTSVPIDPISTRHHSPRDRAFSNSISPSSASPRASPRSRASSSSTHAGRKFAIPVPSPLSASPKAVATIALSRAISVRGESLSSGLVAPASSPSVQDETSSPADSVGEGLLSSISTAMGERRRTISLTTSKGQSALSSLANNWRMSLGRKGQVSTKMFAETGEIDPGGPPEEEVDAQRNSSGASDLLRKLDREAR